MNRAFWVLAGLLLWHAVLLLGWLARDTRPPRWDQSVHLSMAWDYKEAAASFSPVNLLRARPRPGHPPYPPLVHYAMAPLLALAPVVNLPPEDMATWANLVFVAVLALGAYWLAAGLWGEFHGLCGAVLASLLPPVVLYAREPLVDLSLAAWVVMAYACWTRSEGFTRTRWTLFLGLSAGAGMLSKWSFPFYVLPILVDALVRFRREREGDVRKNLVRALAPALILAAPWYSMNVAAVLPRVLHSASMGSGEGDPAVWSAASWAWYFRTAREQIHWLGLGIGAAGFGTMFVRRVPGRIRLAAWLLGGYIFWSLVSNKNDRYLLPFLLPLPLAAAALPHRIPLVLVAGLAGFSAWQTWGPPGRPHAHPPRAEPWPLEAVVERAAAVRDRSYPLSILTVAANHDYMNGNNISWTAEKLGLDDELVPRGKLNRLGEFSEFVLLKTGSLGPAYASGRQEKAREEALAPAGWFREAFRRAGEWDLPDGSRAFLFQRRPEGVGVAPAAALPGLFPDAAFTGLRVSGVERPSRAGETDYAVAAGAAFLKGIALTGVRARLDGFQAARDDDGRPRLLRLRRVQVESALLSGEAMEDFLGQRVRALKDPEVRFLPDNRLRVRGSLVGARVELGGRIRYDSKEGEYPVVSFKLQSLRLAGVPLPVFLLGGLREPEVSLRPSRGLPFELALAGVSTDPSAGPKGALKVGP